MRAHAKYPAPKADLTFKKVFGGHPDLPTCLLNAQLPIKSDRLTGGVEHLPTELVPMEPIHKEHERAGMSGRQFVVEMRMAWTSAFKQMVLFNTSKVYVSQAGMGFWHEDLRLVYSLNLVNDIFEMNTDESKHNYRIVHNKQTDKVIEGLCFTFIELPKFTPRTANKKRKTVLRLRFLTEIDDMKEAPSELMEESDIKKVLGELKASAFSARGSCERTTDSGPA